MVLVRRQAALALSLPQLGTGDAAVAAAGGRRGLAARQWISSTQLCLRYAALYLAAASPYLWQYERDGLAAPA